MPTIKSNEIENTEHQQSTLKVKVSYLDGEFKAYVDSSDRKLEMSVTFGPGLYLACVLQLGQISVRIAH